MFRMFEPFKLDAGSGGLFFFFFFLQFFFSFFFLAIFIFFNFWTAAFLIRRFLHIQVVMHNSLYIRRCEPRNFSAPEERREYHTNRVSTLNLQDYLNPKR